MYWLTAVYPHPVTATLVPTDSSESCKAMLCILLLKVREEESWNFKFWFCSFRSIKISRPYSNRSYLTHIFWQGICKCYFVVLYFCKVYTHLGRRRIWYLKNWIKIWSLLYPCDSESAFYMWTDRYVVRITVAYFQESYIIS
jgi:hypothetical protein